MDVPTLTTARLLLRGPNADDASVYFAFYADPGASGLYGGPMSSAQAWRKLAYDIGHWCLRDHGMWSIIEKATGIMIGGCGIVWPEGWPRPELTWWIIPGARRGGYALEASRAAIAFGYDNLAWSQVETHMRDENIAARWLVIRLGGHVIARDIFPDGVTRDVFMIPRATASL